MSKGYKPYKGAKLRVFQLLVSSPLRVTCLLTRERATFPCRNRINILFQSPYDARPTTSADALRARYGL